MPNRILAVGAVLFSTAQAASASGGIGCSLSDNKAEFEINAAVTHGMGGPVFQLDATAGIKDPAIAKDLAMTAFDRSHLAQYWLDGKEMRLLLYRERANDLPHGYAELTILTEAADEGEYKGAYAIRVFDTGASPEGRTWEIAGDVTCFVE